MHAPTAVPPFSNSRNTLEEQRAYIMKNMVSHFQEKRNKVRGPTPPGASPALSRRRSTTAAARLPSRQIMRGHEL